MMTPGWWCHSVYAPAAHTGFYTRAIVGSFVWNLILSLLKWTVLLKSAVTNVVVVTPEPGVARATVAAVAATTTPPAATTHFFLLDHSARNVSSSPSRMAALAAQ